MQSITITGNATDDAELRYTPSGQAVASFRLAHTDRYQDGGEWKDGETVFLAVSAWRTLATNVAESVHRGDRVTVTGKLRQHQYTPDGAGKPVTVTELTASDVALSLATATARAMRNAREGATA